MNHALYVFFIVVAVFPFRLPLRKKNLIVQQISLIQMSLIGSMFSLRAFVFHIA